MTHTKLISVTDLKALLDDPDADVLILDSSHDLFDPQAGIRAYEDGHLPGARFVSMDRDAGGIPSGLNGRHPLPPREHFAECMRRLGANDTTQIVVCDRSQGSHASRVWWMLRWLGHSPAAVLDGGVQAWQAAGHALTTEVPATAERGNFSDRPSQVTTVSFEDVLSNVDTKERLVVDARAPDRFAGQNETIDPVGGHIPGAVCRFYRGNLKEDGTFKDAAALASEFQALFGDRVAEDLIMQCGSGVSACHNLLALEVAGYGTAPLYIGSWSEWCSRPEAPIATGE